MIQKTEHKVLPLKYRPFVICQQPLKVQDDNPKSWWNGWHKAVISVLILCTWPWITNKEILPENQRLYPTTILMIIWMSHQVAWLCKTSKKNYDAPDPAIIACQILFSTYSIARLKMEPYKQGFTFLNELKIAFLWDKSPRQIGP